MCFIYPVYFVHRCLNQFLTKKKKKPTRRTILQYYIQECQFSI
uniref:Uncharacterized protein n=1 Tax=Anguilla anguilla TaxID=7936 RepID=A0A0E9XS05_ANGAN